MSRRSSIDFGIDTLEEARTRLGLTNREVWEGLGVGETTWMRWKRTGHIPVERITDVVLFLDLDEPPELAADVPRSAWQLRAEIHRQHAENQEQAALIESMDARIRRLEEHLGLPAEDAPRDA